MWTKGASELPTQIQRRKCTQRFVWLKQFGC